MNNILLASILAITAGLIRVVAGWAENALRDGVIEKFEWRQLAGTLAIFLATINVLALGIDPGHAVVITMVLDMVRTTLKNVARKTTTL